MDILITRYIGIKGTAILSREFRDELLERYPKWLVDDASELDVRYASGTDIARENETAVLSGASYAEEYLEFGVYEALFKASKGLKCGMDIFLEKIPIRQETIEVCEHLKVNPYALYSGNSSLIVCDDADSICRVLEEKNIPVSVIGYTTDTNDKIIINKEERGFLPHIRKDELKNRLGRKAYNERTDIIHS